MGSILCRRIYDPAEMADGYRILTDRLWPRGISKERAGLHLWAKELAPSPRLRKWYHQQEGDFLAFASLYREELDQNPAGADFLAACAQQLSAGDITLLTASKDPAVSHAAVLRQWMGERLAASEPGETAEEVKKG